MPRDQRPERGNGGKGGNRRGRASASSFTAHNTAYGTTDAAGSSWRKRGDSSVSTSSTATTCSVLPREALQQTSSQSTVASVSSGGTPSSGKSVLAETAPQVPPLMKAPPAPPPPANAQLVATAQAAPPPPHRLQEPLHTSGEDFLMDMLAAMDQHMQQLRKTQQGLVAIIELSCRRALDAHFGRLVLVGSAALRVETPGSDIDVVCFTRRDGPESVGLPVDVLRRVHWTLKELFTQYNDYASSFSMELIDDARVPILRVLWGPLENPVAVDVSVDQSRPVDHVRWFQRVGAAPRPTAPQPVVAPLVTLTLRCVKWWLRQRQIPRTKEGGLPTLAWLLMVVHVCSLPETHEQAIVSGQRPMAALLASLTAFFRYYAALESLDGVLQFATDGSSSEFRRRAERKTPPWAELVVLDPTREGVESLNLVPRLPPATQLLLAYELRRTGQRLEQMPKPTEAFPGQSRRILEDIFEPMPEGINAMPSFLAGDVGVLVLCGESSPGSAGSEWSVDFGVVERIVSKTGWGAPFLHRTDERSEVHVKLCDVEERNGRCHPRRQNAVVLCPCHFVCCVRIEKEGRLWKIGAEGVDRYFSMRRYVAELTAAPKQAVEETPTSLTIDPAPTPTQLTIDPAPSREEETPTQLTIDPAPSLEEESGFIIDSESGFETAIPTEQPLQASLSVEKVYEKLTMAVAAPGTPTNCIPTIDIDKIPSPNRSRFAQI